MTIRRLHWGQVAVLWIAGGATEAILWTLTDAIPTSTVSMVVGHRVAPPDVDTLADPFWFLGDTTVRFADEAVPEPHRLGDAVFVAFWALLVSIPLGLLALTWVWFAGKTGTPSPADSKPPD